MENALVVLPTYNERENIDDILRVLLALNYGASLKSLDVVLSVLVVDDGSSDGTDLVVKEVRKEHPTLMHLIQRKERGRGSARVVAFNYALEGQYQYILEMDADFSHDPEYVPTLIEGARASGFALGSRYVKGGKEERGGTRRMLSMLARWYLRLVLGRNVQDWQGGFKCYRRDALTSVSFERLVSVRAFPKSYVIGMEMIYRLIRNGFEPKELPILFRDRVRGEDKFSRKEIFAQVLGALAIRLIPIRDRAHLGPTIR